MPVVVSQPGPNLLVNPSFEEPDERDQPVGWTVGPIGWVQRHGRNICTGGAVVNDPHPSWVRSGERNLAMYPTSCSLIGVEQTVNNVTPGRTYRFGAWAKVWSTAVGDDHSVSTDPYPVDAWVCIVTAASRAGESSPDVNVCSAPRRPYDEWEYVAVDAVAQEEQIVVRVYVGHEPQDQGAAIWDDASLTSAPAAATPTPAPAPTSLPSRPAPVPFNADALYEAMLQARSDIEQMGGLLDRIYRGGREPCEDYLRWHDSLLASPVYDGVPPDWGGVYGEYVWAVEHVIDKTNTATYICSDVGGGVLTEHDWGVARMGVNEALDRLGPAIDNAAAMLGK